MELEYKTLYIKKANRSISLLWLGALVLMFFMLFYGRYSRIEQQEKDLIMRPQNVFIDELLLSAKDLKFPENANLININLSKQEQLEIYKDSFTNTAPERKLVYSKIFKNRIKKISSSTKSDGVIIKPLP